MRLTERALAWRMFRRATLTLLVALLANTTGCSLLFTRNPAPDAPGRPTPPTCATSRLAPVGDFLAAAPVFLAGLVTLAGSSDGFWGDDGGGSTSGQLTGAAIMISGLALPISGLVGLERTKRCREANRSWSHAKHQHDMREELDNRPDANRLR